MDLLFEDVRASPTWLSVGCHICHNSLLFVLFVKRFPKRSEVCLEMFGESQQGDLRISLPFIAVDDYGSPLQLEEELSRKEFERICAPLLERLKDPVQKALKDAGLRYQDLDEVVLLDCTRNFRHTLNVFWSKDVQGMLRC